MTANHSWEIRVDSLSIRAHKKAKGIINKKTGEIKPIYRFFYLQERDFFLRSVHDYYIGSENWQGLSGRLLKNAQIQGAQNPEE
jgi:hypothetical protein